MIGKYLYFEFLVPINDYVETIKLKEALFDWCLPLMISIPIFLFINHNSINVDLSCITGSIINFLAILIGFSIACISVLSTSDSDNIQKLKNSDSERKISKSKISLYQHILVTYIFSVIIEFTCLLWNLGYLFMSQLGNLDSFKPIIFSFNIFLLTHIIFLNIRNVTNFYFVFWKKSSD